FFIYYIKFWGRRRRRRPNRPSPGKSMQAVSSEVSWPAYLFASDMGRPD
ncbi:hypothetical protein TrispH2_011732, partial [Trichoplax sp. H2]